MSGGEEGGVAFGRLRSGPHPLLRELLYEPHFESDLRDVLPWLLEVDAAHVVMLAETSILARAHARQLLAENRDLAARLRRGDSVLDPPEGHRGLYLVYEHHYIDRLGSEIGGAAHVARSRNDINATITRLRLRSALLAVLEHILALLAEFRQRAAEHAGTVMSGFTHFQPAQPTTFGHYLTAVHSELLRGADRLARSYEEVDLSPLGAGAGFGTSFPIDRERAARYLGFAGVVDNALDAVASRDYAVGALAALAAVGTSLTRVALDLQLWGSEAFGFMGWPDELVSTSSMMPQKRNVFALENVRGRAVEPASALVGLLLGLKNTPFSNSVEISSEATAHLWPALAAIETAVRLLTLLLSGLRVNGERMRGFLARSETTMTLLADRLVRDHGLAFRVAHEVVGRLLGRGPRGAALTPEEIRSGLREIGLTLLGRELDLDEGTVAAILDPECCVREAVHGGGPAPETVLEQLRRQDERCRRLQEEIATHHRRLEDAASDLAAAIERLGAGADEGAAR